MDNLLAAYPLKLRDMLIIPLVERMIRAHVGDLLPWPSQQGVTQFLRAFGHSDGAIRTALSRGKAQGLFTLSEEGHMVAGELLQQMNQLFLTQPFAPGHFSLLLFHFATEQHQARNALKDILGQFNFKMLTQNAYLRYGARHEAIQELLIQQGFQDHIYHFSDLPTLPTNVLEQLPEIYQLPFWAQQLPHMKKDFLTYLQPTDHHLHNYWRYLVARSAFHNHVLIQAPHLPLELFPAGQFTQDVFQMLVEKADNPNFSQAYLQGFGEVCGIPK